MNDVLDALSREDDRNDDEIINIFCSFTPLQIPDYFKIVMLPIKISSSLISLLQRLTVKEQLLEIHTHTKLGRGKSGKITVDQLELLRMSSSTTLPEVCETYEMAPRIVLSTRVL